MTILHLYKKEYTINLTYVKRKHGILCENRVNVIKIVGKALSKMSKNLLVELNFLTS